MQTKHLLPLAVLITTAIAAVLPRAVEPTPPWQVKNYTEGCSPAACVYTFNISLSNTSPASPNEPSFSTTCTGNNLTPDFQACEDPAISTKEINGWSNVTLIVQHVFTKPINIGEARYTVTGNHTIVNPGYKAYDFEVKQSMITAVA